MFFIFLKSANAYANADANANSKNANTVLNATKNKGFLKLFFCKLSGSQDTIRQKLKLLEAKIGIFLFFSNFDFLCFCSFLIFLAELLKVSS